MAPAGVAPVDHGGTQAPSPRQGVRLGGGSTLRSNSVSAK